MEAEPDLEWWALPQAAEATGYSAETIRKWADGDRVRSRRIPVGQRERRQVAASDVRREVAKNRDSRTRAGAERRWSSPRFPAADDSAGLRDRVASLEEVARRYRYIDALRDQIADLQKDIGQQHREIELILQGPSVVPDVPIERG